MGGTGMPLNVEPQFGQIWDTRDAEVIALVAGKVHQCATLHTYASIGKGVGASFSSDNVTRCRGITSGKPSHLPQLKSFLFLLTNIFTHVGLDLEYNMPEGFGRKGTT